MADVTEELTSGQGSGMSVHRQTIINVKNTSRGDSPEAGEDNCFAVAMAAWAAVMFVFIKLRQSCGELDAPPVLIVLRRTMQQTTR